MYATPWSLAVPVTTPDGLKDPKKAVALLVQAANEILEKCDSLDIAYGDVNRFRVGNIDFPGNGGPDKLGVFRTMYFTEDKDKKNRAFHGEFGNEVKASVLLSYGNSSQPGSKYAGDQLHLLSQKNYVRPCLRKVMF